MSDRHPSHDASCASDNDALAVGTRLAEFEIASVVGVGGFGIVYRAVDLQLRRVVAIKEYLPGRLARRLTDGSIAARSPAQSERLATGLSSFINEARLLARFEHPALVKVHRFWEANGTAYMVMPFYGGVTLEAARRDMSGPPAEAWLRQVLEPLLGALEVLHDAQCVHRDVAPDNIMLLEDGSPVLLDLGAAREVLGNDTQYLTTILKPSFAPIEQYADSAGLPQGPWTDIYALAAVVMYCVTGHAPPPSAVRAVHDDLVPLTERARRFPGSFGVSYSARFTTAIDAALALHPLERPRSVAAWREAFGWAPPVTASAPPAPAGSVEAPDDDPDDVPEGVDAAWANTVISSTFEEPGSRRAARPAPRHRRVLAWGAAAGVLLLSAGMAAWGPWVPSAPNGVPLAANAPPVAAVPSVDTATAAETGRVADSGTVADTHTEADTDPAAVQVSVAAPVEPEATASGRPVPVPVPARRTNSDRSLPVIDRAARAPQEQAPVVGRALPSPRQACGNRVFISLALCMDRQCKRKEYERHPQCLDFRELQRESSRVAQP